VQVRLQLRLQLRYHHHRWRQVCQSLSEHDLESVSGKLHRCTLNIARRGPVDDDDDDDFPKKLA
jgi:hypothetical protein